MTRFEFLTRYVLDQALSLSRNPWLVPFICSHLARRLRGFRPDTYVVSYPKSGRTWLRTILMNYYSQEQGSEEISWSILEETAGKTVVFNHADGTWRPLPKKIDKMRVSSKFASKKVVLLVRDPRDVLVSNWYHLSYRYRIYSTSLTHFIREELLGIDKIIHFMNLWIDQRPLLEDLLIVRYEDMASDAESEAVRVLHFIGERNVDPNYLERAIARASFENMRKLEADGQHNPFAVPSNLKDWRSFKNRKGIVGDWKNHFSPVDAAFLDQKISSQLRKEFGYSGTVGFRDRPVQGKQQQDWRSSFRKARVELQHSEPQSEFSAATTGGVK